MSTHLRCWILFFLFTVLAMPPLFAATGVPELVKDISTATDDSSPGDIVYASGWFYFAADDGVNGWELWKTDGTTGNTGMVEDLYPGPNSSAPRSLSNLGGTVLFWANTPTYGVELWKTDGTTTTRLSDIPPATGGAATPLAAVVSGSYLYFSLKVGDTVQLWKSGGTEGTTAKITDIGTGSSATAYGFVDANGTLYFVGSDGSAGYDRELWKSDGSPGGTGQVVNFNPDGSGVNLLFGFGDKVLFQGDDGDDYGYELCISDGTPGGTERLKDINPGWRDSFPKYFAIINGKACFGVGEPWVTDGTVDGTKRLAEISGGTGFIEFGGTMYFKATYHNGEEWVSGIYTTDGTPENTTLFKGEVPFSTPVVSGATLFFTGSTEAEGTELWSSNGTASGTDLLKDLLPGPFSSSPEELCAGGGLVAFAALHATKGKELWVSDGTAANTDVLRDINTNGLGTDAWGAQSVEINGVAYFPLQTDDSPSGQVDAYGKELWRSDATGDGTYRVMDINPGADSSEPRYLVRSGDTLFFSADDGTYGRELWMHDGPTKATARVTDINTDGDSILGIVGAVNGRVIFWASGADGSAGNIWWSDGTTSEILIADAGTGAEGSVMLDGKLIFFGTMDKLYATDGYPGGTDELGDPGGSLLTAVGDKAFFTRIDDSWSWIAYQLWYTDGTTVDYLTTWRDGTRGIDLAAGITAVGNKAFFVADESSSGTDKQLWTCDATTLDVEKVTTDLTGMFGRIYSGVEYKRKFIGKGANALLESDGTPGNTTVINDTVTFQGDLTPLGGLLYFKSYDGAGGSELWRTDATENGAERVADIMPGSAGSDPQLVGKLVEVLPTKELSDTETLLFFADSPGIGTELWKVTEPAYDDADTTGPVVTVTPPNPMILERGLDTYVELGATAIDDVDGSVTVFTTGSADVDTTTLGTYWVMYTAYDAAGNGGWASRRVDVVEPLGLCDVLANSAALLGLFRNDFEIAILGVCGSGLDDLACSDPEHDPVYDDAEALGLAYGGACPGSNATIAASTHAAFAQNQLELAELANANPGYNLRRNVDILAALCLLSAARRDGVVAVFVEAGIDVSEFVPVAPA